jgi:hypothetical protein
VTRVGRSADEGQHAREDVAELSAAPTVNEAPGSFHRIPKGFRSPDQVFSRCGVDAKTRAHLSNYLAPRLIRQVVQGVTLYEAKAIAVPMASYRSRRSGSPSSTAGASELALPIGCDRPPLVAGTHNLCSRFRRPHNGGVPPRPVVSDLLGDRHGDDVDRVDGPTFDLVRQAPKQPG